MVDSNAAHFDGLSSLITLGGFAIPARARFVAKFVGSSLFSSLTLGLVAGQTGAALFSCGPLIPFMAGSCIGYTWGCIGYWRQCKNMTMAYAKSYPKILAHSLCTNMLLVPPKDLALDGSSDVSETIKGTDSKMTLDEWIVEGGIGRLSYAILAAQSCEEDIQEMHKSERQKIVDKYSGGIVKNS
ncbi:hypothetical protein QTG54_014002 [Skeletonema marinoi]|uniref:Uncharacterized protein n=1 Tax=Skeletonema marinoi TaxID=267567 RepID=A0AAD9D793_9STRA|nr:hypothetical protein QTG54_014002 [Skeletonema marinoi]